MITIQFVYLTPGGRIGSYKVVTIGNFNQLIFLN